MNLPRFFFCPERIGLERKGERSMVANRKVTGTAAAMPVGLAIGLGVSMGVTLLGSGILAWLINREMVAQSGIGYGSLGILLAASLLGAAVSEKSSIAECWYARCRGPCISWRCCA